MEWQFTIWCILMLAWPGSAGETFTGINAFVREYIGRTTEDLETKTDVTITLKEFESTDPMAFGTDVKETTSEMINTHQVKHAALPTGVAIYPLPLERSDHELKFNVTWDPPVGARVQEYSLEVHSMTDTVDCRSNLCYEYNIPGDSLWSVIPSNPSPVVEDCAVRPGCAYRVKLIAHPWDGHTAANIDVELDECVAGVCSCAHSPRLPKPIVRAKTLSIMGDLFVNVTWTLPSPMEPLRLPPRLMKKYYFVSIGKQMVSDAHPAPWFAHARTNSVDATGFVVVPDTLHWLLLKVNERNDRQPRGQMTTNHIVLDVKLLARVSLVDERGCVGPAGNATAYDPADRSKSSKKNFALWAAFGGACMLGAVAILACGARVVKRVLNKFRPASASAPQALGHRPLWQLSA